MAWQWESTCSACAFVSRQLGPGTPCPSHAGRWSVRPSGESSSLAAPLPAADCPWPFTRHQYARLLLLRGRIRQGHPRVGADLAFEAVSDDRSPAWWTDEERMEGQRTQVRRAAGGDAAAWVCPDWLRPYLHLVTGSRSELVHELMSACAAEANADLAQARRIAVVRAQVRLLETLHARGLLRSASDEGAGR